MRLNCPHCNTLLEVPDSQAGQKSRCGTCNQLFQIPRAPQSTVQQPTQPRPNVTPHEPVINVVTPNSQGSTRSSRQVAHEFNKETKRRYPNLTKYIPFCRLCFLIIAIITAGVFILGACVQIYSFVNAYSIEFLSLAETIGYIVLSILALALALGLTYLSYIIAMCGLEIIQVWIYIEVQTRPLNRVLE